MKEILQRCLLNWNVVKNNAGKRTAPKVSLYPYMLQNIQEGGTKGRAVINDVDGIQWEALYISSEQVTKDFDVLCTEYFKVFKREG